MCRGEEDLVSALDAAVPLLIAVKEEYDFSSLKSYEEEDINDIISDLTPKLLICSSNPKLQSLNKSPADLLEHALSKL